MEEYPINFIIPNFDNSQGYFVGKFEETEDPEVEWPHRHSFYSIILFTMGNGINVIDFSEYKIRPNRIFTINPKQVHNWNYSKDSRGYILIFEAHLAKELDIEFASSFIDIPDSDKIFFNKIFEKLIFESQQNDHLGKKNSKTGISYLYSLINRFASSSKTTNPILTNFKNLICQNFSETQTIDYYAKCLHISTTKLNTYCTTNIGITAKQFQLDLKITEAKRLLIYSSFNASEVAYQTGFEDVSYFSRIFKKKTGVSPTNFKEKYLNNGQKS